MKANTYDDDAQLASSLGYNYNGTPITSEQLGFQYDPAWNMTNRSVNGAAGVYAVDDRNQLTAGPDPAYTYDANGNMTSKGMGSGTTSYSYDDENRLIRIVAGVSYRTDFTYDGLSRLRVRTEYSYSGGTWNATSATRYIYDGMNVVQERDGNNTPTVAYTRGPDLSSTLQGAGGIGGMLARTHGYSGGNWSTHNFYHADGMGNITYLVNSSQGLAAKYKYDPYGRIITWSGPLASVNVYRFSSKELHVNSGLYYFGYRFYDPNTQRWMTRDPIGEIGGMNMFALAGNDPLSAIDPLGLLNACKGAASLGNACNSGRLYAAGLLKIGAGLGLLDTGIGSGASLPMFGWGLWNIASASNARNAAVQLAGEAWNGNSSDATLRNLLGVLPYGTLADDPGEPSYWDVVKSKARQFLRDPLNSLVEFGKACF